MTGPYEWIEVEPIEEEDLELGGLSNFGVAVLGFNEMCQCGHDFGMHDSSGRCAVYRCGCGTFAPGTPHTRSERT